MKALILLVVLPFLVSCGTKFKLIPSVTKTETGWEITTSVELSSKSPKKVAP